MRRPDEGDVPGLRGWWLKLPLAPCKLLHEGRTLLVGVVHVEVACVSAFDCHEEVEHANGVEAVIVEIVGLVGSILLTAVLRTAMVVQDQDSHHMLVQQKVLCLDVVGASEDRVPRLEVLRVGATALLHVI